MSARDLLIPNSAFGGVLERTARRLRELERRANWPGAVQSAYTIVEADFGMTIQDIDAVGFPRSGMKPVVTLTLDPGRWILQGIASQWFEVRGSDSPTSHFERNEMGMILEWESDASSGERRVFQGATARSFVRLSRTMSCALEVRDIGSIDVTLNLYIGTEPGYTDDDQFVFSAQVLAYPG
jgi:hypothetical protein